MCTKWKKSVNFLKKKELDNPHLMASVFVPFPILINTPKFQWQLLIFIKKST